MILDAARIAALADELRLGALPHAVVDLHGLVDVAKENLSSYEPGAILRIRRWNLAPGSRAAQRLRQVLRRMRQVLLPGCAQAGRST